MFTKNYCYLKLKKLRLNSFSFLYWTFSFPRPLKWSLTPIALYFKAIMDMYTDEMGFQCKEFLQDLKVGITFFVTFLVKSFSLQWNHTIFLIKNNVTSVMSNRFVQIYTTRSWMVLTEFELKLSFGGHRHFPTTSRLKIHFGQKFDHDKHNVV